MVWRFELGQQQGGQEGKRAGGSLHGKEVQSKEAARRSVGWDGVEIKKLLEIDCVSSWPHPMKDQVS